LILLKQYWKINTLAAQCKDDSLYIYMEPYNWRWKYKSWWLQINL